MASQDHCDPYLGGTAYEDCGFTGIWGDGNAATNTVLEGPSATRLVLPVEGS